MSTTFALLSILGALLLGAISPGPSFVMVSRVSIGVSRRDGLAAAFGMGTGGAILGTLALLGVSTLLTQLPWLYEGLKLFGGGYFLYLGIRIWRGASAPPALRDDVKIDDAGLWHSFLLALTTQLANPKTVIVYAGIFSALLPRTPSPWLLVVLPPMIFLVEVTWYAVVALAFSTAPSRSIYLNSKGGIDRLVGGILGALGVTLIVGTVGPQ